MSDMLMQYALFLSKTLTFAVIALLLAGALIALARRGRGGEGLTVRHLNRFYDNLRDGMLRATLPARAARRAARRLRRDRKSGARPERPRIFVINFRGDITASAVSALREEVSAVLTEAGDGDEVAVRLENAGGVVHDHGLAAAQLARLKAHKLPLTILVDKVAASGGYLMACVADRLLAAPFAVLGSIGVVAQTPNFNRLLDRHGVDFEMITAGEYKRTVTMFGKNTDKARAKLRHDIEDVHGLFKDFVAEHRPQLDLARVSTGEHWYGSRALALQLVDGLQTSDDYLLTRCREADLYEVTYSVRKRLGDRVAAALPGALAAAIHSLHGRAPA